MLELRGQFQSTEQKKALIVKKERKTIYRRRPIGVFNFVILKQINSAQMITVPVQNNTDFELPQYATAASAGVDLKAAIKEAITLAPLERSIIPTGLKIALPEGYEAQVRPRSGLAAKHGITVLNSPGTIDADYRGEIGVILVNLSQTSFTVQPEERIAQLVVAKYEQIQWEETGELSQTNRGSGGFGSTGKK